MAVSRVGAKLYGSQQGVGVELGFMTVSRVWTVELGFMAVSRGGARRFGSQQGWN